MYRLILVDDEPWALTGLEEILSWGDYGFQICGRCTSAAQALREIAEKKPDVVCTDIRMPCLSGIDLISRVRSQGQDVEFIIISAYSDFEVARKAINYGAAGYILKPLEQEEVAATILRLKARLDQKRAQAPLPLDLNDPSSLRDTIASLPPSPGGDGRCYVAITESACAFPPEWAVKPLELTGARHPIYYCAASGEEPSRPCTSAGWSRPRANGEELGAMIREAQAAFSGGFTYSDHPAIAAIQAYLGENFGQNLSLAHLAAHFFLSESYLCELFKKNTGCTVLNFLIQIRLQNACRLLWESPMSIKEIAAAVGFNDYSYFGRIFRRNIGKTPDQYRAAGPKKAP